MTLIEARNIIKIYTAGNLKIRVLDDISLKIDRGEFVVVKGDSGSGKTTLLSILSGLDSPDKGDVFMESVNITDMKEDELAPMRNKTFGFVFQSFHLIPALNALENVMFPAELDHDREAGTKARDLLKRVGLGDRLSSFPHQLSGGEKQRVAICRALVNNPKIIFADEPTGNLDSINSRAILKLIREFHEERNLTLLLVTHSMEIAGFADRIITMKDGKIHLTESS